MDKKTNYEDATHYLLNVKRPQIRGKIAELYSNPKEIPQERIIETVCPLCHEPEEGHDGLICALGYAIQQASSQRQIDESMRKELQRLNEENERLRERIKELIN